MNNVDSFEEQKNIQRETKSKYHNAYSIYIENLFNFQDLKSIFVTQLTPFSTNSLFFTVSHSLPQICTKSPVIKLCQD